MYQFKRDKSIILQRTMAFCDCSSEAKVAQLLLHRTVGGGVVFMWHMCYVISAKLGQ